MTLEDEMTALLNEPAQSETTLSEVLETRLINLKDIPLPAQVEKTCTVFEKQFRATSERCFQRAEQLQRIVDELTKRGTELGRAADEVPAMMADWVRAEREGHERQHFFSTLK